MKIVSACCEAPRKPIPHTGAVKAGAMRYRCVKCGKECKGKLVAEE